MNGRPTAISQTQATPFAELRKALSAFATGVTVMTALDADGQPHGVTATSFAALSLDPPLIQWSLRNAAWSLPIFMGTPHFAVNVLASDQEDICRLFASASRDRFSGLSFEAGVNGVPLIHGAAAWFECKLENTLPGGDHTIIIGHTLRSRRFEATPLLHWNGHYAFIAGKEQGRKQTQSSPAEGVA